MRLQRNTHHHERTSTLKCSLKDKTEIFDTLRDLLRDRDVNNNITIAQNLPDILQELQNIEDGNDDLAEKYELDEELQILQKDIKTCLAEHREQTSLILQKQNQNQILSIMTIIGVGLLILGVYLNGTPGMISFFINPANQFTRQEVLEQGKVLFNDNVPSSNLQALSLNSHKLRSVS